MLPGQDLGFRLPTEDEMREMEIMATKMAAHMLAVKCGQMGYNIQVGGQNYLAVMQLFINNEPVGIAPVNKDKINGTPAGSA